MSAPPTLPQGLVTLLFTDVQDHTPMNAELGNDLYRAKMLGPLLKLEADCIREQQGTINGPPEGDSIFAVFHTPDAALACAKAMQERLRQTPITHPGANGELKMRLRIGIHTAETHMTPDDQGLYHGSDVNLASRVMSLGAGGQILVSPSCHNHAGSRQLYHFHTWEGRYLKGIAQPLPLYEMLWYEDQKPQEPGSRWLPDWMRRYTNAFIGREEPIKRIVRWLQGDNAMLVLHGPGGIGKTRLAVQTLLRIIDHYQGHIYGVALDREFGSNPTAVTPELFAAAIARAVKAPKEVLDAPVQRLASYLETRPALLLFLDNGESAFNEQTLSWLSELLLDVKKARWLVSTRSDPGLEPHAESFAVDRLAVPQTEQDLHTNESYKLFKARVELRQPAPKLDDTPSLLRILRFTDGFPLGVELAARQRQFSTLKEIADGLDASLLDWQRIQGKQSIQRRADEDRHQNMEACIHWSVQMLSADDQQLYAHLSLFAFDFAAPAAEAIAQVPRTSLVDWQVMSLLERLETPQTTRYRLRPVFREYAARRLAQDWPTDADPLAHRYMDHYAHLIEANANINLPEQKAMLDAEWRNALEAAELAARTNDWAILSPLSSGLRYFLYLSIYGAEATRLQELAHQAATQAGDVLGEANCIRSLGDIALARSDHEGARQRYEEALPRYRQVGDVLGEANCIQRLGDIALRRSDHEGARQRYEEALPLYQQVGDVLGEANCIQRLGDIALARSDHEGARQRYEEALRLYEQIQEPYSIGWTHRYLARLAPDEAEKQQHVVAARDCWTRIKFDHLVRQLDQEFGP